MTIDEAIDQLSRGTVKNRSTRNQKLREALELGIEALKGLKAYRQYPEPHLYDLLPSETKD